MIEIIDLGINNVASVRSSIQSVYRGSVRVINNPGHSEGPRLIVIPGTGAFGAAIEQIDSIGFRDFINTKSRDPETFIVGICLGMQLLGTSSEESPGVAGLGLVEAKTDLLPTFPGPDGRRPHVGWATINPGKPGDFEDSSDSHSLDVYFSHSFHLVPESPQYELLVSLRGNLPFVAGIRAGRVAGFQFHPEKSSQTGISIIRSLVSWSNLED